MNDNKDILRRLFRVYARLIPGLVIYLYFTSMASAGMDFSGGALSSREEKRIADVTRIAEIKELRSFIKYLEGEVVKWKEKMEGAPLTGSDVDKYSDLVLKLLDAREKHRMYQKNKKNVGAGVMFGSYPIRRE